MIEDEELELQRARQVIDYNPKLKNERTLEGVRASPDFDAYERLCRGEPLPRQVRYTTHTLHTSSALLHPRQTRLKHKY